MLNRCCVPGINNTQSACIICFIHCWFLFVLLQKDVALWVSPLGCHWFISIYQGSTGFFFIQELSPPLPLGHLLLFLFFYSLRLKLDLKSLCSLGWPRIFDSPTSVNRAMGVQVFTSVPSFTLGRVDEMVYTVFWMYLWRIDVVSSLNVRICPIALLAWAFFMGRYWVSDGCG